MSTILISVAEASVFFLITPDKLMKDLSEKTSSEINQDLMMMIDQYGLTAVLENLSRLATNGHLEAFEVERLNNIATYLVFAADTVTDNQKARF